MSIPTDIEIEMVHIRLRKLRIQRGLSQRQLAKDLGTSHPTINRWESGENSMTLTSLKDIADYFGVSMASMFSSVTTTTSSRRGATR